MVYIAGDCRFLESPMRDQQLITNWNEIVNDEDEVLLLGNFFSNWENLEPARAREITSKLKGKLQIADYSNISNKISRGQLQNMGIPRAYNAYMFVPDKIYTTHIIPEIETLNSFKGKMWGAAVKSLTGFEKVFEHNILSLSIDDWGLAPIEYEQVPLLVENMKDFYNQEEV